MRTPTVTGSSFEPEYYKKYGQMIFDYTTLKDKAETEKISRAEKKALVQYEKEIPAEVIGDWFLRREKNFDANKYFVDLMKSGAFEYFLVGCDDNAPFSQTHLESRHLSAYAEGLVKTQFQIMAGADELGMLMISRAINKSLNEIPFVAVSYNEGVGGETIPSYSNEKISASIDGAIFAVGGLPIPAAERADIVLAVNTNLDGKTFEADSAKNTISPRKSTRSFMKLLNNFLSKNYPVAVVDVATANGSDNALMEQLRKSDLLFKIQSYGGWNTVTNTSGFLIGSAVLNKFMTERDRNSLLITRYLDDWAYQANIRTKINGGLIWTVPGEGNIIKLDGRREGLEKLTANLISDFAQKKINLPVGTSIKNISVKFAWNRTFEAKISFD